MHKILAEIIAGVIPDKMARNRWRGILRFGLTNAVRLKRRLAAKATRPACNLAVCAIAKDEGTYFKEWIEWHIGKGVDKFIIYDNGSTDNTKSVLRPYIDAGTVEYISFPGYRRQLAAYDDCLRRHRLDFNWIAFIDLDEFIVPVADKTVPEFLKRFEGRPAVEINWLVYGSSNMDKRTPGGVMQRFRFHSVPDNPLNRHVKSIVNPRLVFNMIGCHEAACISGRAADSHGDTVTKNFRDREPLHDVIRINHYAVKSYEEFIEKQARGRASGTQRSVKPEYFCRYNLNDIEDTSDYDENR